MDIRRRLRFAEGFDMALREALFHRDPSRTTQLWQHLHRDMTTRFQCVGEASELTHMLFRMPCSAPVEHLLDGLLDIRATHTDLTLLDISICAHAYDRQTLLMNVIERWKVSYRPFQPFPESTLPWLSAPCLKALFPLR